MFALSLYYLYRAVNYRFVVPGRMGPPNPIAPGWYYVHVLFALPVLLLCAAATRGRVRVPAQTRGAAEGLCDRLALLGQGRILAEGPTRELIGTGPSMAHAPSRLEQLYLEKLRP